MRASLGRLSTKINCWSLSTDKMQHVTGLEIKANLILRNWEAEQPRRSSREHSAPSLWHGEIVGSKEEQITGNNSCSTDKQESEKRKNY